MTIPLILAPVLTELARNGLNILAGAITAKGKEVVEETLGVNIEDSLKSEEGVIKLKELEFAHEETLLRLSKEKAELEFKFEESAQKNVTQRWQADMASDSMLSKNIRPMTLIYLTLAFTFFILIDGFVSEFNPDNAYVTLLAELLKMVYTAYFVGRTVEKGIEMYQTHATNRKALERTNDEIR